MSNVIQYWRPRFDSTPFNPTLISGCELWHDSADNSTITLDIDSLVEQWDDKSGNNRHARNDAFPTLRPPISSSTLNGLQLLNNTGSGRHLQSSFTLGDVPITIFFVGKKTTVGSVVSHFLNGNQVIYRAIRFDTTGVFFVQRSGDTEPNSSTGVIAVAANDYAIFEGVSATASDYRIAVDGGSYTGAATSQTIPSSPNTFSVGRLRNNGNVLASQTEWGEVVMYSKVLTTDERSQVISYFKNKWGL